MEEQVDEDVKHDRLNRLMELQNDISLDKNQQLQDKVVKVMVEGQKGIPKSFSVYSGLTSSVLFCWASFSGCLLRRIR